MSRHKSNVFPRNVTKVETSKNKDLVLRLFIDKESSNDGDLKKTKRGERERVTNILEKIQLFSIKRCAVVVGLQPMFILEKNTSLTMTIETKLIIKYLLMRSLNLSDLMSKLNVSTRCNHAQCTLQFVDVERLDFKVYLSYL